LLGVLAEQTSHRAKAIDDWQCDLDFLYAILSLRWGYSRYAAQRKDLSDLSGFLLFRG
jgi:hypothetical protein